MIDRLLSGLRGSRRFRGRASRPQLEPLEGRILLYATTGDKFSYGNHLTLSIVPDGTSWGGPTSNLISTLNSQVGGGVWQKAFQDAAAWWENYANINMVWVGDNGTPLGQGKYQQGDPGMGDIRIGGFAQPLNTLAFTELPPPANGDSSSGDITFNTAETWSVNSGLDLETIAIHEIGHALGLGHSADTWASMYYAFNGIKQSPDNDDVAGIQAIWGTRPEDGLAQGWANYLGSSHAANINPFMTTNNNQITLPNQDIASAGESYWFKFTTPANANSHLSVAIQSVNLSELSPGVQIYDANMNGLVQTSGGNGMYGGVVGVTYTAATPNTTYYIRVMSGSGGGNGAGAYALLLNDGTANIPLVSPTINQVAITAGNGGGGSSEVNSGDDAGVYTPSFGGANDAANTPVDEPDSIIYPTFTEVGDFLTLNGVDPANYRIGQAPATPVTVPVPSKPVTVPTAPRPSAVLAPPPTAETKTATPTGSKTIQINVARPSGPASASQRPAQEVRKTSKLGE